MYNYYYSITIELEWKFFKTLHNTGKVYSRIVKISLLKKEGIVEKNPMSVVPMSR